MRKLISLNTFCGCTAYWFTEASVSQETGISFPFLVISGFSKCLMNITVKYGVLKQVIAAQVLES